MDDVRRERDQLSYLPHLHRDPVLLSRTLSNAKGYRSASLLSARVTCPHSSQMNLSVPAVCVAGISRAQSCSCRCAVIFLQLRHSFVTIRVVSLPGKKRRRPAMILLVRHQLSAQLVPLRLRSHRAIIAGTDFRYRQVPALPSLRKRIQQYIHFRGSATTAMKGGSRLRVLPGANCSAGGNRPRDHKSLAMEISLNCLTP
jgi:hypothetical protein